MIDLRTVVFSYVLISAVCSIVVAFLWLRNRGCFAGLGFWAGGYAIYFIGTLAMVLRASTLDQFSTVAGYALFAGGSILIYMGLERFLGKRGPYIHNLALLAALIFTDTYFTGIHPNLGAHIASVSLAMLLIFVQPVWLIFRRVDAEMRSISSGTGIVYIISCSINLIRILLFLIIPPDNVFFGSNEYETSQLILSQAVMIALAFSLIMMVNRRLVTSLERDITEHKQAEKALYASETLFRQMFTEHSAAKLLINPENGNIVDANPAASQFYGYPIETLLQMKVSQINTMTPAEIEAALEDARLFKRNYFIFQHRLASGEIREVEIYSTPIRVGETQLLHSIIHDITERKQMEAAMIASQKLAEELYESAPNALVTFNLEGRITRVNSRAEAVFGYSRGELLNQPVDNLIPERLRARHQEHYKVYYQVPQVHAMNTRPALFGRRKDGQEFPAEIGLSPFQIINGKTFVIADIRDITERKQMDQALRYRTNVLEALNQVTLDLINRHEMEDILQTLLMKISALLDASDISFDLVENGDTLVTYAVTSEQPLKKGDTMRRGEGGWLSWQAIDSGEPAVLDDYVTWANRRALYEGYPIHAIMIVPIHQRNCVIGAINISRCEANKPFNETDIYVAKQLAQMAALVLDNAQLYSQLQSELIESVRREGALHEAQEQVIEQQRRMAMVDERQRMARDLHDSVNQSIHSLILFSETLVSTLDRNNIERARHISERMQESARQALKETRLLLYQTQVAGQERGVNLIEELNARLATVEGRAGVRTQIIQEGLLENCPKEWYQNIFWITLEALNNSLKHAQARSVQIILRSYPTYVELEVSDDGRGFDTTKPRTGGYGLRNMQERAELLGGTVTITSSPQQGARVVLHAEIKEQT